MNYTQDDINNLRFLLVSSKETLVAWYHEMSDEDTDYAMELLKNADISVVVNILYPNDVEENEIDDVSDAMNVLSKFMITGAAQ
jgi:hypothetical protein